MFNKMTMFSVGRDDIEFLDGDLLKTAALKLPDGFTYDPDFFYMMVRGVSAGEYWGCNKNQDYFPEAELIGSHQTFLTAHAFKNHENKDIKNAIGDVISEEWDDYMKSVKILMRIDRKIAPTIVRGFEKGFMTDVSMGCRINHSVCSICGNKAKTKFEYCDHIKYQRGQILPDGRKVYEINIGPKFHDISAVLNGAEKSAKVIGMMIVGNKVAFEADESLDKVASLEESITASFKETGSSLEKVAHDVDLVDLDLNMYKKMDKKAFVQKVAEIKKEIQGNIVGVAKGEYIRERQDKAEHMSKLFKLLYENYWDKKKCRKIAAEIKQYALRKGMPNECAFDQFLKVLNFAGIELSPLEMHDISNEIAGNDVPDIRKLKLNLGNRDLSETASDVDRTFSENSMLNDMNFPTLFRSIMEGYLPNKDKILNSINLGNGDPIAKTRATIILVKKPSPSINDEMAQDDMMQHIVKPLMPERSMHRNFLIQRLMDALNGDMSPHLENAVHFAPVQMLNRGEAIAKTASALPLILSGLLYSTYQDERVASCMDGSLLEGIKKFAGDIYEQESSVLQKTAGKKKWGAGKAILLGIPAVYTYSALQRARINHGDNVNVANRYIAQSPGNASLLQVALTPMLAKKIRKSHITPVNGLEAADNFLYNKFASDGYDFEKEASESYDVYGKDMFQDSIIDHKMMERYSGEQVDSIKRAFIMIGMQKQASADEILHKQALSEVDMEQYLKCAVDCIKIEIEKSADTEVRKQMAGNVAGDMIFNPKGVSALAAFPGNIIDSYIFTKLLNKANKDSKLLEQEAVKTT